MIIKLKAFNDPIYPYILHVNILNLHILRLMYLFELLHFEVRLSWTLEIFLT